jgi:Xaa-Pro aminopeptidase/Xaa-Pro dipeptidase
LTYYAQRRKRLLSLARGKQVVALTPANLFWLTSFWGGGAAIALPDTTVVVTSPLEADRARETGKEVEVVVAGTWNEVPDALMKRVGKGPVVADDDSGLRGRKGVEMDPNLFLNARRTKDEEEIARIQKASVGLDRVFEEIPRIIKPGRTEWQAAAEVMKIATQQGLTPSGSDSALSPVIVASGENGALPHSELTSRKFRQGDFVVVDIFFRHKGYNSDSTRTFAVGATTAEMKNHYAVVREAQAAALELAMEGKACEQVHLAAVEVLRSHGVDKFLNHSVGHGVGIDIHELPRISKGNKLNLERNDVITDEPGIYLPGKYGIRIEDTLVVGKRPSLLTKFTRDLVTCG